MESINSWLCAKKRSSRMSAGIASLYIISQRCIGVPLCGTSVLNTPLRYPASCTTCLLSSRSMQISFSVPFLPPHNTLPSRSSVLAFLSGVTLPTGPACSVFSADIVPLCGGAHRCVCPRLGRTTSATYYSISDSKDDSL